MRRTRQLQKSNEISLSDVEKFRDEDSNNSSGLTDEQYDINKQLKEAGMLEDGMTWKEKMSIYNFINASVNTAKYEETQRNSPNVKSQEGEKTERKEEKNEININTDDEINIVYDNTPPKIKKAEKSFSIAKIGRNIYESLFKPTVKAPGNQRDERETEHLGQSEEEKVMEERGDDGIIECDDSDDDVFQVGRKRPSSGSDPPDNPKKSRTETGWEKRTTRDEMEDTREERRSEPYERRSIDTIRRGLELTAKRVKEVKGKLKPPPAVWGKSVHPKNFGGVWNARYIPARHLNRYKTYLLSKDIFHPIFSNMEPAPDDDVHSQGSEHDTVDEKDTIEVVDTESVDTCETKSSDKELVESSDKSEFDMLLEEDSVRCLRKRKPAVEAEESEDGSNIDVREEEERDVDSDWVERREKKIAKRNKSANSETRVEEGEGNGSRRPRRERKGNVKGERALLPARKTGGKNMAMQDTQERENTETSQTGDEDSGEASGNTKLGFVDIKTYRIFNSKNNEENKTEVRTFGNVEELKDSVERHYRLPSPVTVGDESSETFDFEVEVNLVPCPICNETFPDTTIETHAQECAANTFQD